MIDMKTVAILVSSLVTLLPLLVIVDLYLLEQGFGLVCCLAGLMC